MNRPDKIKYIQERLGDSATVHDAARVLAALEDSEVVIVGKDYHPRDWEEEVRDVDLQAVLEEIERGEEAELQMRDRLGWIRSFIGVPSALEVLAQRLEREGYNVAYDGGDV